MTVANETRVKLNSLSRQRRKERYKIIGHARVPKKLLGDLTARFEQSVDADRRRSNMNDPTQTNCRAQIIITKSCLTYCCPCQSSFLKTRIGKIRELKVCR